MRREGCCWLEPLARSPLRPTSPQMGGAPVAARPRHRLWAPLDRQARWPPTRWQRRSILAGASRRQPSARSRTRLVRDAPPRCIAAAAARSPASPVLLPRLEAQEGPAQPETCEPPRRRCADLARSAAPPSLAVPRQCQCQCPTAEESRFPLP
eukprot:7186402-Prymnesium_polylepis.2